MEPNEMRKVLAELKEADDNYTEMRNLAGMVYEDHRLIKSAIRCITALQAKIDGMIKRPKIGVVLRDSVYFITINGMECDTDDTPTTHYEGEELKARYRRALGMDDSTNTKEPQ